MTKVSIVILNWNRKEDTLDCLRSLEKLDKTGYKLKVIVVDNGSTDDSVKTIKDFKSDMIKPIILENDQNLGFTGGNNRGIKRALRDKTNYIMMLNNDTEVDSELIVELLKVARKRPKAGIFSPKIYFAKGFEYHRDRYKQSELGKVIWWAGYKMDWKSVESSHVGVDEVDKGQFDKVKRVDNANGTCMLIKRKVIESVGLLDTRYYLYWEETDFSQRAIKAGWDIFFVPKAIVHHKVSGSSETGGNLQDYFLVRNRLLFAFLRAPFRSKLTLLKWGIGILLFGREWQKIGARDFFLGRFGKGSWK